MLTLSSYSFRCFARPAEIDAAGQRRTREYTDILVDHFDPGLNWDSFGVVADVVVSFLVVGVLVSLSIDGLHLAIQPFTNYFPRADIHELLSPDLLHQLMKGSFKDHIVSWVEQYLVNEHGKDEAKKIMDDVDRRFVPFLFL